MSDEDGPGRKTAYRIEYSPSARAKCKGPKPCSGSAIGKGEMRLGTLVDIQGRQSFQWRHFGCSTAKFMGNVLKNVEDIEELDGFEDMRPEDQAKIKKAFETMTIEDEDIPETARKPAEDVDADGADGSEKPKPKAKRASKKKAVKDEDNEDAEVEEPPKKRARKAPKSKKEVVDEDDEDMVAKEEEEKEEEKPKKRAAPKKAAPKPKAEKPEKPAKRARTAAESKKAVDEALADDGEELTEQDEEDEPESGGKRKRAPKKAKPESTPVDKPGKTRAPSKRTASKAK